MTRRNPRAGVTLIETLVALLVMATVAILLSSGLGGLARTFNRSSNVAEAIDQALARRELRIWLEHALLVPAPGDERPLFVGQGSGLTFLSQPSGTDFWPGVATQVNLSETASARALGIAPERRVERSVDLVLAPADTRLSFTYWGQNSPETPPEWKDEWPASAGLPALVRIDFTAGDRALPPLIIKPGKASLHSEMSLSSLVPPALPSRP